jgi:hypothetical protein
MLTSAATLAARAPESEDELDDWLEAVMTTRIAKSGDEVEAVSTKASRINRPQQKADKEH